VLDRVRSATGDRVDHPRGTHDDAACAVAGVAILARELGAKQTGFICEVETKSFTPVQPSMFTAEDGSAYLGDGVFRTTSGEHYRDPRYA